MLLQHIIKLFGGAVTAGSGDQQLPVIFLALRVCSQSPGKFLPGGGLCRQLFQSPVQTFIGGEQHIRQQFFVTADRGQGRLPVDPLTDIQLIDPLLESGLEKMTVLLQTVRSQDLTALLPHFLQRDAAHGQSRRSFFLLIDQ